MTLHFQFSFCSSEQQDVMIQILLTLSATQMINHDAWHSDETNVIRASLSLLSVSKSEQNGRANLQGNQLLLPELTVEFPDWLKVHEVIKEAQSTSINFNQLQSILINSNQHGCSTWCCLWLAFVGAFCSCRYRNIFQCMRFYPPCLKHKLRILKLN